MNPVSVVPPVFLVVGEDPALLSHASTNIVDRLCGDERSLVFAEVAFDADIHSMLRGVNLFASFQVLLVRRPTEERIAQIIEYLGDPEPATRLVVAVTKASKALVTAVKAVGGEVIDAAPRKAADAVKNLLENSNLVLDARSRQILTVHVGEESSKVPAILSAVESVYGAGARIGVEELESFLGDAGTVPPWDLTDALDSHDTQTALRVLQRTLVARAPLAIFASLSIHYERLFRLSEAGITSETEAAKFLGMKGSTYPAQKALRSMRRYKDLPGSLELVAAAATDLRGGSGWPAKMVLEVLVGRLATRP